METEDNIEVGSQFRKNLIRTDSLQKELVEEDTPTIRDYNDYVCYRRKRAAIIAIVVVVLLALVTFMIVYFTHIRPNSTKGKELEACRGNQLRFQPVENKCFIYRDVNTREIMFKGSAKECMEQCFSYSHCLSVDFFLTDGECWLFTVTSRQVLWEWSENQKMSQLDVNQRRKLQNCAHYDRLCM